MKIKLTKALALTLFFMTFTSVRALDCVDKKTFYRCDIEVISDSLKKEKIPVFLYISTDLMEGEFSQAKKNSRYVLFLHGRGYARNMGAKDSMLEHLEVGSLLNIEANKGLIFVAPQDNILQSDSKEIGQDYWVGAGSRDWLGFLASELPRALDEVSLSLDIDAELETVMGISMGAHGALMLGHEHSGLFKNVIALSPVFRSTISELSDSDHDVFLKTGEAMMDNYNFGTKLLKNTAKLSDNYFIEISKADFGLEEENFPTALENWNNLMRLQAADDNENHISISNDSRGHSHGYWKEAIIHSVNWLHKVN